MLAELAYYYHWSDTAVEKMSQKNIQYYHNELIRIFKDEKQAIEKEQEKAKNQA